MFESRETFNLFFLRRKINRPAASLLVFLAVCLLGLPAEAQYGDGTGEPNDPYQIWTAEQMNAIGADTNDWDKHFKLMADIDMSIYSGSAFLVIGNTSGGFRGCFDGNGRKIRNLTIRSVAPSTLSRMIM